MFETECGLKVECKPCIEAKLSDGEQDDICSAVVLISGQGELTPEQVKRRLFDEIELSTTEPYVSVRILDTAVRAYNLRKGITD